MIFKDTDTQAKDMILPSGVVGVSEREQTSPVVGMRIIVTGGRDFTDRELIYDVLSEYDGALKPTLVHGACPTGADHLAAMIAADLGWTVAPYPADWKRHGRAAGPTRNCQMARAGADIVIAFSGGRGTRNMCWWATTYGIPIRVVATGDGPIQRVFR